VELAEDYGKIDQITVEALQIVSEGGVVKCYKAFVEQRWLREYDSKGYITSHTEKDRKDI
jgi:hypothetical protein